MWVSLLEMALFAKLCWECSFNYVLPGIFVTHLVIGPVQVWPFGNNSDVLLLTGKSKSVSCLFSPLITFNFYLFNKLSGKE